GFEDIDCISQDGSITLVQVKEKGAGAGRMAAEAVAEVLAHAVTSEVEPVGSIVLVTDGDLGSQLKFTGWHLTIAETAPPPAINTLTEHLRSKGLSEHQITDVFHQA